MAPKISEEESSYALLSMVCLENLLELSFTSRGFARFN